MNIFLGLIVFVVSWVFGVFSFAQIVYPLFITRPLALDLKKANKLKKEIPAVSYLGAPLLWGFLVVISWLSLSWYFPAYLTAYQIVMFMAFISILVNWKKAKLEAWEDVLPNLRG